MHQRMCIVWTCEPHAARLYVCAAIGTRGGAAAGGGVRRGGRRTLPLSSARFCRLRPFICTAQVPTVANHIAYANLCCGLGCLKKTISFMQTEPSFRKSVAKFIFHIFHRKIWAIFFSGGGRTRGLQGLLYNEQSDELAKLPEKLADARVARWQSKYERDPTIQQRPWLVNKIQVRSGLLHGRSLGP